MPLAADIVGEGMRAVRPMEGAEKALIAGAYSDNMEIGRKCNSRNEVGHHPTPPLFTLLWSGPKGPPRPAIEKT